MSRKNNVNEGETSAEGATVKPKRKLNLYFCFAAVSVVAVIALMLLDWVKLPSDYMDLETSYSLSEFVAELTELGTLEFLIGMLVGVASVEPPSQAALAIWAPRSILIYCGVCILLLVVYLITLFVGLKSSDSWGGWGFLLLGVLAAAPYLLVRATEMLSETEVGLPQFELTEIPYIVFAVAAVNVLAIIVKGAVMNIKELKSKLSKRKQKDA
jgi:hypothetical protein